MPQYVALYNTVWDNVVYAMLAVVAVTFCWFNGNMLLQPVDKEGSWVQDLAAIEEQMNN